MELIRLDVFMAVRYAFGSNAGLLPQWVRYCYVSEPVALERWQSEAHAQLRKQLKCCPLCGSDTQEGCAIEDCDNDWTDFWRDEP